MPKTLRLSRRQRTTPRHRGSVAELDGQRQYRRFANFSQQCADFLDGSKPPVVFILDCAECKADFYTVAPKGVPRVRLCTACWNKSRAGGRVEREKRCAT